MAVVFGLSPWHPEASFVQGIGCNVCKAAEWQKTTGQRMTPVVKDLESCLVLFTQASQLNGEHVQQTFQKGCLKGVDG